jgi:hypothetical protein
VVPRLFNQPDGFQVFMRGEQHPLYKGPEDVGGGAVLNPNSEVERDFLRGVLPRFSDHIVSNGQPVGWRNQLR